VVRKPKEVKVKAGKDVVKDKAGKDAARSKKLEKDKTKNRNHGGKNVERAKAGMDAAKAMERKRKEAAA